MQNAGSSERALDLEARRQRCLRLIVVDGDGLCRTGIRTLLAQEGHKVIDAAGGQVALRLARSFRPDVVVTDVNMPDRSGIEVTRMLVTEHPGLPVLILTSAADDDSILEAFRAGAVGYLLEDARTSEIVAGIEAAAAGQFTICPRAASTLVRSVQSAPARSTAIASVPPLSERERTVLALVAQGCANAEIANRLYISPSTVRNLLSRVFEKLGVDNRVQAATLAVRHKLDLALDS